MRDHIKTGHRNFLKQAVYFLYTHNRLADSAKWFRYLKEKYPGIVPPNQTLDDYAVEQVITDVGETSHIKVQSALEGFLINSFYNLAIGEDELAVGYNNLALKVWQRYQFKTEQSKDRVGLPPFEKIRGEVKERVLDPKNEILSPVLIKQLMTALGLSPGTNAPVAPP
jgi:hypothetical protein